MPTRTAAATLLASLALGLAGLASHGAHATDTISIATSAAEQSPTGQALRAWEQALAKRTGGATVLKVYYKGAQGPEDEVLRRLRTGRLDGAVVGSLGLGQINRNLLVLQMPGLFATWAKLDAARGVMEPVSEKQFKTAGFTNLGWADIGSVHFLSRGFEVRQPADLKNHKPHVDSADVASAQIYKQAGVTPVLATSSHLLTRLNAGTVDIIHQPLPSADLNGWSARLDTIHIEPSGLAFGALVMADANLNRLTPELRAVVIETGKQAAAAISKRVRAEDAAALARAKARMKVVTPTVEERAQWQALYKQVRAQLARGTFDAKLVESVEGLGR